MTTWWKHTRLSAQFLPSAYPKTNKQKKDLSKRFERIYLSHLISISFRAISEKKPLDEHRFFHFKNKSFQISSPGFLHIRLYYDTFFLPCWTTRRNRTNNSASGEVSVLSHFNDLSKESPLPTHLFMQMVNLAPLINSFETMFLQQFNLDQQSSKPSYMETFTQSNPRIQYKIHKL